VSRDEISETRELMRRIVILDGASRDRPLIDCSVDETTAFISIGAGETHISIMSSEARRLRDWVAIFGWTQFSRMSLSDGSPLEINLDDEDLMRQAFAGQLHAYGLPIPTDRYVARVEGRLRVSMGEILDRTLGTAIRIRSIRFAAPPWMHAVLSRSIEGLRPNISTDILETG